MLTSTDVVNELLASDTSGWPQAIVQVVMVLAILVWPGYMATMANRRAKSAETHAKTAAETITHEANPNSGSSMKDDLNRIQASLAETNRMLAEQGTQLATLGTIAVENRTRINSLERQGQNDGRGWPWQR